MNTTAVITDSNSGMKPLYAASHGIGLVAMPFTIDGVPYLENVDLPQELFDRKLREGAVFLTSQPGIPSLTQAWDEALKEHERVIYIPMSSGLSGSCATAQTLAQDYGGRVLVIDNKRISVMQKQAALEAKRLVEMGKSAEEIKELLDRYAMRNSIYIAVDTLEYLKKGGRIAPAAAGLAAVLSIKPVMSIMGGMLEKYDLPRGMKRAHKVLLDAAEKDMNDKFAGVPVKLFASWSDDGEEADAWMREIAERFPGYPIDGERLPDSILCHIGHGAVGIGLAEQMKETGMIRF